MGESSSHSRILPTAVELVRGRRSVPSAEVAPIATIVAPAESITIAATAAGSYLGEEQAVVLVGITAGVPPRGRIGRPGASALKYTVGPRTRTPRA